MLRKGSFALTYRLMERSSLMMTNATQTPKSAPYVKTQKYLHKRYHALIAYIMDKKQEAKDIRDIPKVRKLLDVFPRDLPGIPLVQQVKFKNRPKMQ